MRIAVITVSDSTFLGERADLSGPAIKELCEKSKILKNVDVVLTTVVADDQIAIANLLKSYSVGGQPHFTDVILTTGGTGFAPRDVTPEATKSVIERECPGIVTALLLRSLQATPMAALTRLVAGIAHKTLIINLPGSPKAVKECFEVLEPILNHAVQLINDDKQPVAVEHKKMQDN